MRLAYVCAARIPSRMASSVHVMKMCHAFAAGGHEVTLLAPDWPECRGVADDLFAYYGVEPCFQVRTLRYPRFRGRSVMFAQSVAATVRQLKVDLAYAREIVSCSLVARSGVPTVYEAHWPFRHLGRVERPFFRWWRGSTRARRLVVISRVLKADYLQLRGLTDSDILVAPDGADPMPEVTAPVYPWPGRAERLQVGYCGHLSAGRGIELIADLAAAMPDIDFHLVGGNDADLARWRSATTSPNFILHGFVEPRRVPSYHRMCDVLIAPYQQDVRMASGKNTSQWMSPLKVFEYMASGRPMVVSDLPVLREVLTERNAKLVPHDDRDAWRTAIRELVSPTEREALGARARQDLLDHYTWQRRAENVLRGLTR